MIKLDILNQKFNRLTVIEYVGTKTEILYGSVYVNVAQLKI